MTLPTLRPEHRAARLVHPSSDQRHQAPVAPALLNEIAAGLAPWASSIHHTVPGDPTARRYVRLLATPAYEAWLIVWPTGTGLELHDHGDSSGVLRVVAGELIEAFTDRTEPVPLRVQRLAPGDTVTLSPTRIHDVWNPSEATAVTVHLYSPPLATMTFYATRGVRDLEAVRTECATTP